MLENYWRISKDLLSYPEFWAVFRVIEALLWLGLGVVIIVTLLHILYMLGFQSPLYRKRTPHVRWNRRFFWITISVSCLILVTLAGIEWVKMNMVVDQMRQSVIHW